MSRIGLMEASLVTFAAVALLVTSNTKAEVKKEEEGPLAFQGFCLELRTKAESGQELNVVERAKFMACLAAEEPLPNSPSLFPSFQIYRPPPPTGDV